LLIAENTGTRNSERKKQQKQKPKRTVNANNGLRKVEKQKQPGKRNQQMNLDQQTNAIDQTINSNL
jgi:hypothetical protein